MPSVYGNEFHANEFYATCPFLALRFLYPWDFQYPLLELVVGQRFVQLLQNANVTRLPYVMCEETNSSNSALRTLKKLLICYTPPLKESVF